MEAFLNEKKREEIDLCSEENRFIYTSGPKHLRQKKYIFLEHLLLRTTFKDNFE